jgi:hypothetical protein
MIQKITAKKNESINRILLQIINSTIDNHGGLLETKEWEFALQTSGITMEFLSLQGRVNPEDSDLMFDIIHKVKNMFLNKLEQNNLRNFIRICDK